MTPVVNPPPNRIEPVVTLLKRVTAEVAAVALYVFPTIVPLNINVPLNVIAGTFLTVSNALTSGQILAGVWDFNIYASSSDITNVNVSYFASAYYVDSDGSSNQVIIAEGSVLTATAILYENQLDAIYLVW